MWVRKETPAIALPGSAPLAKRTAERKEKRKDNAETQSALRSAEMAQAVGGGRRERTSSELVA
jgi:hypothetical protein